MKKLTALFAIFVAWLIIVTLKLFYIQIIASEQYVSNAYLQTQRITPFRGSIFDRNGEPMVLNKTEYLLFVEPKLMNDEVDVYVSKLDKILELGEATLEAKFETDKLWVPIASSLSEKDKKRIDKYNLPGLGFEEQESRFYPEASAAAHLLGFVGKDEDGDNIGYFGVEGFYNKDLAGLPGIIKTERDVLGKPILLGTQDRLKGENGRNLYLTIDKSVQMIAKRTLLRGIERYRAESGCIIVMMPSTGEVLALVCLPDFDPVEYSDYSEDYFRNPSISDAFEPGSILKPLIVAAALNEGKLDLDDTYNESGPIQIGKYFIRTWNNEYHGKLTIPEILQYSSNTGMVYVGRKLGQDNTFAYLEKYGLGKKTGIDLQGEVPGILKPRNKWSQVDYATVTFGQGVAVTPIQMITAFSSLVNGGWVVKPYVVSQLVSEEGEVKKIKPKKLRRVVSTKTSEALKKILQGTVKHGEAKWRVPEGYQIGGKTGTAQIPIEGRYDPNKTNASFIGFAPAPDPKFIALVTLNRPQASPWASETAAPLFFELAQDLLVYYNISPN